MNRQSIIGRMFAAAAANSNASADADTTVQQQQPAASRSASPMLANTKRNLFGIRLNHDQLKQDLKDMWKDQMERQKQNWNFDFEQLKPAANPTVAKRFEWTQVNTKCNPFYNESSKCPIKCLDNKYLRPLKQCIY